MKCEKDDCTEVFAWPQLARLDDIWDSYGMSCDFDGPKAWLDLHCKEYYIRAPCTV